MTLDLEPDRRSRNGGQLLVDCIDAHDVPLWTSVPGESFLPVLDAIYELERSPSRIDASRLIVTRHEAAAAHMAEAAGKLTSRAAVCLVTRGPGATHAAVGLHTAYQDGTPMLLVVGQVPRPHIGRQAFQEMDFERLFAGSAKLVINILDVDRIPEHVARAIYVAHSGRPGPVVLVVPEDILYEESVARVQLAPPVCAPQMTEAEEGIILKELSAADRPILVVGGPGWNQAVGDRIIQFAERNMLPVFAGFRWEGSVSNNSPVYAGYLGLGTSRAMRQLLQEADLIVGFGPRLDDPTSGGYGLTDGKARVLLVSEDVEEVIRSCIPDIGICCNLASAAEGIERASVAPSAAREEWLKAVRAVFNEYRELPAEPTPLNVASIVAHVRRHLPDNAVVTTGAGNYTLWVQRFFEFREFGTQLAPRSGTMGYGLPAGLAAAALDPTRRVVSFAGDGCFMMSSSELATAVQYELPLVVIVINNSMLGTIRMHQERTFPGRVIGTDLFNPDFVAYAESFGVPAFRVDQDDEFPSAFATALGHQGPTLIEIRTDPDQITPDLRLDDL